MVSDDFWVSKKHFRSLQQRKFERQLLFGQRLFLKTGFFMAKSRHLFFRIIVKAPISSVIGALIDWSIKSRSHSGADKVYLIKHWVHKEVYEWLWTIIWDVLNFRTGMPLARKLRHSRVRKLKYWLIKLYIIDYDDNKLNWLLYEATSR